MYDTMRLVTAASTACLFLSACAGPSSPLGAPWITKASDAKPRPAGELAESVARFVADKPSISFYPRRQVLHAPTTTTIKVYDPDGIQNGRRLVVRHNGLDVTRNFMRQAKVRHHGDGRTMTVKIPTTRFSPTNDHVVEVAYETSAAEVLAYSWYEPPRCKAFEQNSLATTGDFRPSPALIELIESLSTESGFSPVFMAALIAQESSFNPRTVSWARAIGLTQITPAADKDLSQTFAEWPRYPGINAMAASRIKFLVLSGKVNARNDWRLDSKRSIQGGLAYLGLLTQWWSTPVNIRKIEWAAQNRLRLGNPAESAQMAFTEEHTKLLLASYNSGYARVLSALHRMGPGWQRSRDLKEARRYVNRIFSLCDSFSEEGDTYEDET